MEEKNLEQEQTKIKIKKKRKPQRIYEPIKEEDFLKLINSTNKQKQQTILLLAYGSGLRLSEILNLQPENIDVKNRTIFIRQGKGSQDRYTLLAKQFREEHKKFFPLGFKSKMAIQRMFNSLLIKNNLHQVIGTYSLKSGKVRNIYKYHFHSLRHSFAVNCLAKGLPLNVVQRLMGHKNIKTTGRYTELNARDAIEIALQKGI